MVNSGDQIERAILEKERQAKEHERLENLAAPVIAQGGAAEAFKSQPFWKVIERDLKELEGQLVAELTDSRKNLSKYVMDELRRRITDIRLFIELPNKYIQKLRDVQKRGRKVA